jgi:UDP-N-acetylmuramoyl-tripeptide--D-alanyl-D-alanine ligase
MKKSMSWTTADILAATHGDLLTGNTARCFSGVSIDSREISVDDLFVAIRGNVHDGHSFIENVIAQGVKGFIVNRDKAKELSRTRLMEKDIVCVAVDDTTRALGDLGAYNRHRSRASVVAITGSTGKTSCREMTAGVVSRCFKSLSTRGNLNNEIGLPLTLLQLDDTHQWAVVELGMNRPGEIARLGEICSPDVGVITNIGPAHLEGLGSIEGVMNAKGEILEKIKPEGTAVLNADDPRVLQLAARTSGNVLFFGLSQDAAIRASSVREKEHGVSFDLMLPGNTVSVDLNIFGHFMVSNALAAAAVGYLLGIPFPEIKAGLEDFKPVRGRMNLFKTERGIHIIDDTYNANPASMEAAIMTLRSLKGRRRGALVAGDMRELGGHAEDLHRKIGALSVRSGISRLYFTGKYAESVRAGAWDENMDPQNIFIGTREEIIENLKDWLRTEDWVLVKGSRAMGMEKVVQALRDW